MSPKRSDFIRDFVWWKFKVADLSLYIFGNKATDGTKPDLNIGFQGLALIQGQIYNPEIEVVVENPFPFLSSKDACSKLESDRSQM